VHRVRTGPSTSPTSACNSHCSSRTRRRAIARSSARRLVYHTGEKRPAHWHERTEGLAIIPLSHRLPSHRFAGEPTDSRFRVRAATHHAAICRRASAHRGHASAQMRQCSACDKCRSHSSAHASQADAQTLQRSAANAPPRERMPVTIIGTSRSSRQASAHISHATRHATENCSRGVVRRG